MKKSVTFFCAFLISVSLLGQTITKKPQTYQSLKGNNRKAVFESFIHRNRQGRLFTGHKINHKETSALKSTQAIKQRLDSVISKNYYVNKWINHWKEEYTYDSIGNNTKEIDYNWDNSTSQWVNQAKYEFSYNSNGNKTQEIDYNWDNTTNQWVNQTKYEFSYNSNGNKTQEIDYNWDNTTNQWAVSILSIKREYTYDAYGNLTQGIDYSWVDSTNQWVNLYKYEFAYNANGNLTQEIDYSWVDSTSLWVVYGGKVEYSYDANRNLIQDIGYSWVDFTSLWIGDWKDEFTYNNSYSLNELLLPVFMYKTYFTHMLTGDMEYTWSNSTNEWVSSNQDYYYYSNQDVTGVSQFKTNTDVEVYPNPATDYIIVGLKNRSAPALIEIYDLSGRKIISRKIFGKQQISVRNLKKGIYICKITYKGKTQTTKIRKN